MSPCYVGWYTWEWEEFIAEIQEDAMKAVVRDIADLRLLAVRISRAKTTEHKSKLLDGVKRISEKYGVRPNILREYTEESPNPTS